jgi:plasmid stability protein
MAQLLVRDLDELLVKKLKSRARAHGVSAEEEHRRILNEVLSRPDEKNPTLIEFLLSAEGEAAPGVELELDRSREIESRETGI